MKSETIAKRLIKLGYEVEYKKFGYWDNILHCKGTAIARLCGKYCSIGVETDVRFADVLECIGKYKSLDKTEDINGHMVFN